MSKEEAKQTKEEQPELFLYSLTLGDDLFDKRQLHFVYVVAFNKDEAALKLFSSKIGQLFPFNMMSTAEAREEIKKRLVQKPLDTVVYYYDRDGECG